MTKNVFVILANGCETIEAMSPIDVLRRAGCHVTTLSLSSSVEVKTAQDVIVKADKSIGSVSSIPDAIVLPGGLGGAKNIAASSPLKSLCKSILDNGGHVCAICATPGVALAPWGMLHGKRATCYPSFEKSFHSSTTYVDEQVVVDGQIVTSAGPGTALPFSYKILEVLGMKEKASQLSKGMLYL
ncbi:Protein/nucleic acid deglycase DJ-1 like protein [Aduncisulcus paluster]|uniref:Protein/nucleic acid deglycase DJ-1 like protein n=1 Tax=Aduncisulcus paluster TaxID=2918883 RepID=A0ABQ5K5T5_9EUKA|nr:Protein/nucleic acid deglycase DJ-1 like protein [Aduncisulcus paluster]|eukprot:gnl/Carplike_NY0171/1042_a1426_1862.p1 GENE.gnl/Carplike_NY0171/1042_a1426_1862~~gnl/Carplike_NY0171/1042_a1426_1862.p1  ORF type:complete len:185 (-),score=56.32 gnl/Carplike_NY0171/1042_a1426_1862:70-624(-)